MKRQFFVIPILFISFLFIFSSDSFAKACCEGTAIAPSKDKCDRTGLPFQCTEPEPLCDTDTNTCIPRDSDLCGGDGQKCCGTVCDDDLVCIYPGQVGEECVTKEEACLLPGANCNATPFPPRNPEIFCTYGVKTSGIKTALGCINVNTGNDLIKTILQIATGIGGGLALALILYGVFIVTTSAGMPDKLKAGSEIITSAIIGLIFILLSIFLVNLIGINILGIPGLS